MLFHSFMQMKRCHRAHFTAAITRKKENKHDNNMQLMVIKKISILKLIKISDNKKRKVSMCTFICTAAGAFPGFYATKHIASLQNEMVDHQKLSPLPQLPFWNFVPVTSEVGQHPLRPLGGERHWEELTCRRTDQNSMQRFESGKSTYHKADAIFQSCQPS